MLAIEGPADCWSTFSHFWTESIPETFERGWSAVSNWVDVYVRPFFESIAEWFQENADWLWPVGIGFAILTALIMGTFLSCIACKSQDGSESIVDRIRLANAPLPTAIDEESTVDEESLSQSPIDATIANILAVKESIEGLEMNLQKKLEVSHPDNRSPLWDLLLEVRSRVATTSRLDVVKEAVLLVSSFTHSPEVSMNDRLSGVKEDLYSLMSDISDQMVLTQRKFQEVDQKLERLSSLQHSLLESCQERENHGRSFNNLREVYEKNKSELEDLNNIAHTLEKLLEYSLLTLKMVKGAIFLLNQAQTMDYFTNQLSSCRDQERKIFEELEGVTALLETEKSSSPAESIEKEKKALLLRFLRNREGFLQLALEQATKRTLITSEFSTFLSEIQGEREPSISKSGLKALKRANLCAYKQTTLQLEAIDLMIKEKRKEEQELIALIKGEIADQRFALEEPKMKKSSPNTISASSVDSEENLEELLYRNRSIELLREKHTNLATFLWQLTMKKQEIIGKYSHAILSYNLADKLLNLLKEKSYAIPT